MSARPGLLGDNSRVRSLGSGQAVRLLTLDQVIGGSNPPSPAAQWLTFLGDVACGMQEGTISSANQLTIAVGPRSSAYSDREKPWPSRPCVGLGTLSGTDGR